MFDKSKTLKTEAPKKGKKKVEEVKVKGLEEFAMVDSLIKTLDGLRSSLEAEVKDRIRFLFVRNGEKTGKRPENFKGVDGSAEASCQLRVRSSRSALSEDEEELLTENGLPVETITDTVGTFVLNPDYANDEKLMAKVEKALEGVKGLPKDLFVYQEAKERRVVSEDALDMVFKKKVADELIDVVGTLAIRAKVEKFDAVRAMAKIKEKIEAEKKLEAEKV